MHANQKIGVGIVTCNRKEKFKKLLDLVVSTSYVDHVYAVKNRDFDYGNLFQSDDARTTLMQQPLDVGVGACKNMILKKMLEDDCQHLFLIEDDIQIKDIEVFKKYIDAASAFNLKHLIFGSVYTPPSWNLDPVIATFLGKDGAAIDLYGNLHGGFVYFTRECIQYAGLFDEQYVNAVEHIDHTYRICTMGMYTPFWAFADIHDSSKYLEDEQPNSPSTINDRSELQRQRTMFGFSLFQMKYGKQVFQIPKPSRNDIMSFISKKVGKQ